MRSMKASGSSSMETVERRKDLICDFTRKSSRRISVIFDGLVGVATFAGEYCSANQFISRTKYANFAEFNRVINILGMLLLGASNYCMQCLSAPTREEVDLAHNQKQWLEIGIPSVRNLRHVSRTRIRLWWLLALSSIPLQLFYNSAIFATQATLRYTVYTVSSSFVTGSPFNRTGHDLQSPWDHELQELQDSIATLQTLSNRDCMKTYGERFIPGHGDVLTVPSTANNSDSLLAPPFLVDPNVQFDEHATQPYDWMCGYEGGLSGSHFQGGLCTFDYALSKADEWMVQEHLCPFIGQ